MTRPDRTRRRWAVSYALSLLLHTLVLLAFVVLAVDVAGDSTEIAQPSDVSVFRRDAPQPVAPASPSVLIPPTPTPSPLAESRTVPVRVTVSAAHTGSRDGRAHALPRAGQPPELARNAGEVMARPAPVVARSPAPEPAQSATATAIIPAPANTAQTVTVYQPTMAPATSAPSPLPTNEPSPRPLPSAAPSPSPVATQPASPSPVPTAAPSPSPIPTLAPSPRPVRTVAPSPSPIATVAPSPSPVLTHPPSPSPVPTRAASASPAPTVAPVTPRPAVPSAAPSPRSVATNPAVALASPAPAASGNTGATSRKSTTQNGNAHSPSAQAQQPPPSSSRKSTSPAPANAQAKVAQPSSASNLASLNARLKALTIGGNVDYSPQHVAAGNAQSVYDDAMLAYAQRLAPPPDILRRTFGFIYARRTLGQPDSIAYVYDTYKIGPIQMCKAWKITEHPYVPVHAVGAVAGSAGIGGAVARPETSSDVRHDNGGAAEVETVQFPCTEKSYTHVAPGSLATPLNRNPDLPPDAVRTYTPQELPTSSPTP